MHIINHRYSPLERWFVSTKFVDKARKIYFVSRKHGDLTFHDDPVAAKEVLLEKSDYLFREYPYVEVEENNSYKPGIYSFRVKCYISDDWGEKYIFEKVCKVHLWKRKLGEPPSGRYFHTREI